MIKHPIQLLRDDFFELTRVIKTPEDSSLEVVNFFEQGSQAYDDESAWIIALRDPKNVKLIKLSHQSDADSDD